MNVNSKLSNIIRSPALTQLTSQMAWATMSFKIPKVSIRTSQRRNLAETTSLDDSLQRMFWIGSIILPIVSLRALNRRRLPKYGILAFPQLELTLAQVLMIPFVDTAASFFYAAHENPGYVFAGIVILLVLPIPLLLYSTYFLYNTIVVSKTLCYRGKEWYIIDPQYSQWLRAHESLYNGRVGYMYKLQPLYEVDPDNYRYKRYQLAEETQSIPKLAPYVVPMMLLKKVLVALFMGSIRTRARLIPIVIVSSYNSIMALCIPTYHALIQRVFHAGTTFAELALYFQALLVAYVPLLSRRLEMGLLAAQLLVVGIPICGQLIGTVYIIAQVLRSRKRKRAMDKFMNCYKDAYRRHILVKKYANRWKWVVLGKPLYGWPRPLLETRKVDVISGQS